MDQAEQPPTEVVEDDGFATAEGEQTPAPRPQRRTRARRLASEVARQGARAAMAGVGYAADNADRNNRRLLEAFDSTLDVAVPLAAQAASAAAPSFQSAVDMGEPLRQIALRSVMSTGS